MAEKRRSSVAGTEHIRVKRTLVCHVIPFIGGTRLAKVSPADIKDLYSRLEADCAYRISRADQGPVLTSRDGDGPECRSRHCQEPLQAIHSDGQAEAISENRTLADGWLHDAIVWRETFARIPDRDMATQSIDALVLVGLLMRDTRDGCDGFQLHADYVGDQWAMIFRNIQIAGWRQYRSVNIALRDRLTILTGANGAGKTTILNLLSRDFGWQGTWAREICPIDNSATG